MNPDPYTPMAPAAPFDYTMRTTAVMEHSRGIAWTADLLRNGATVGTIEQHGDGGPDRVYADRGLARADWNAAVTAAFAGDEEAATYWLLVQEEDADTSAGGPR